MKATFFLLLALICLVQSRYPTETFLGLAHKASRDLQATTCRKTACSSKGQNCLTDTTTRRVCTDDSTFCSSVSVNGTVTSATCIEKLNVGANCTFGDDCKSQICSARVCVAAVARLFYNGEACSSNTACVSGICTSSVCVGIANGVVCDSGEECNSGYCNEQSVCAAQAATNGACDLTSGDTPCADGLTCVPRVTGATTAGVCIQQYTGANGAFCRDDIDCADGHACFAAAATATFGVCGQAAASSKKACDDEVTNACGASEECYCNGNTGNNICLSRYINNPKGSKDAAADLAKCVVKSCRNNPSEECFTSKCKKQGCNNFKISINSARAFSEILAPKCAISNPDAYTQHCSASILSTASVIAVAFLGAAALLF